MAYFGFTNKLVNGETIKIFNYGNCKRDFTYIDDIVEGIVRVMQHAPEKQNGEDSGADSWDLFLSLGKIYKTRDERLATIYIDPDLKRILDRLKTASSVKLPTAAILSSIVARFIFDHEKEINDVIFGERLI